MKDFICAATGVIGAAVAAIFGGWSAALTALVICMAIDYITGVLVAGVFHASAKTKHGGLESRAGWKGLVRKIVTLLVVLVAYQMDKVLTPPPAGGDVPIYTLSKDEATGRTSPGLPVNSVAINATSLGNVKPATRIGIFGRYDGDTPERFALMRFFREKIWDGDTLLREFVPAMENATEEVGLYDIVNGVFYRNAGTGVLVGGAR